MITKSFSEQDTGVSGISELDMPRGEPGDLIWGGVPVGTPYLQFLQLLQLVAEVAGILLQVVEVQLHVQASDGCGLPRWCASGGRGWWGRHWGPHVAPTGG